ncbi:type II secretion system protein [Patescibacteria group bacterium]
MASRRDGFTFIEFLVSITVLGIITVVGIGVINPVKQFEKARDTERKSDLAQYRVALESFASAHNSLYPGFTDDNNIAWEELCVLLEADDHLSDCPEDPRSLLYLYRTNGLGTAVATATEYVLWVELEEEVDGNTIYWEVCSDGRTGQVAATVDFTDAVCDVSL